jgi:hypothetical protein
MCLERSDVHLRVSPFPVLDVPWRSEAKEEERLTVHVQESVVQRFHADS